MSYVTLPAIGCVVLPIAILTAAACSKAPQKEEVKAPSPVAGGISFDAAFWGIWGDGKAEIAAYDLVFPRYKQARNGVAVAIFVTEPFSNRVRVKADPGKHPRDDEFPVMKLNLVKDYQTGIYDYNDMTSSFVALQPMNGRRSGAVTKVSFSSQEWCGHVYMQMLFGQDVRLTSHSYFDGEADEQRSLDHPEDGLPEDALPLWARRMAGPEMKAGEQRDVKVLMSLETSRGAHKPVAWQSGKLTRGAATQTIKAPAGQFEVESWSAALDGFVRTFYVEATPPHRIVKWETSAGERAELLGAERLKYWEMNREGGEAALTRIGLKRRLPRMP